MASSQGDVRPSRRWMAYPAVRPLPKLPLLLRTTARDADYLLDDNYVFGQNMTEYKPCAIPGLRYHHPANTTLWLLMRAARHGGKPVVGDRLRAHRVLPLRASSAAR